MSAPNQHKSGKRLATVAAASFTILLSAASSVAAAAATPPDALLILPYDGSGTMKWAACNATSGCYAPVVPKGDSLSATVPASASTKLIPGVAATNNSSYPLSNPCAVSVDKTKTHLYVLDIPSGGQRGLFRIYDVNLTGSAKTSSVTEAQGSPILLTTASGEAIITDGSTPGLNGYIVSPPDGLSCFMAQNDYGVYFGTNSSADSPVYVKPSSGIGTISAISFNSTGYKGTTESISVDQNGYVDFLQLPTDDTPHTETIFAPTGSLFMKTKGGGGTAGIGNIPPDFQWDTQLKSANSNPLATTKPSPCPSWQMPIVAISSGQEVWECSACGTADSPFGVATGNPGSSSPLATSGLCANGATATSAPAFANGTYVSAAQWSGLSGVWQWTCPVPKGVSSAQGKCQTAGFMRVPLGVCGNATFGDFSSPPASDLCGPGQISSKPGIDSASGRWTWTCQGAFSGAGVGPTTTCYAGANGVCGSSAIAQSYASLPTTDGLCLSGSASNPIRFGNYGQVSWQCSGTDGESGTPGTSASCFSAVTPVCGSATKQSFASSPTNNLNLCAPNQGAPNLAQGAVTYDPSTGTWTWYCYGFTGSASNGGIFSGSPLSCTSLPYLAGACGSAVGVSSASQPTTANLCASGTGTASTPVSNAGPWTWTCSGVGGAPPSPTCTAPHPVTISVELVGAGGGGGAGYSTTGGSGGNGANGGVYSFDTSLDVGTVITITAAGGGGGGKISSGGYGGTSAVGYSGGSGGNIGSYSSAGGGGGGGGASLVQLYSAYAIAGGGGGGGGGSRYTTGTSASAIIGGGSSTAGAVGGLGGRCTGAPVMGGGGGGGGGGGVAGGTGGLGGNDIAMGGCAISSGGNMGTSGIGSGLTATSFSQTSNAKGVGVGGSGGHQGSNGSIGACGRVTIWDSTGNMHEFDCAASGASATTTWAVK